MGKRSPAAELEHFLNFVEACSLEYKNAYDKVNEEDRRVPGFPAPDGICQRPGRTEPRGHQTAEKPEEQTTE